MMYYAYDYRDPANDYQWLINDREAQKMFWRFCDIVGLGRMFHYGWMTDRGHPVPIPGRFIWRDHEAVKSLYFPNEWNIEAAFKS